MAKVPYSVYAVDLSAVKADPTVLVPQGMNVGELILFIMPANAQIELSIGTQDFFLVNAPFMMEPTGHDEGIYYRNLVGQPATVLQFVVVPAGAKFNVVQP